MSARGEANIAANCVNVELNAAVELIAGGNQNKGSNEIKQRSEVNENRVMEGC